MNIDKIDLRGFSLDLDDAQKQYAREMMVAEYNKLVKAIEFCSDNKIDEEYVKTIGMNWQYKHVYALWQTSKKIKFLMEELGEECFKAKEIYDRNFIKG